MKKGILAAAVLLLITHTGFSTIVATWNFESPNPADSTDNATYPNLIAPATGTGNAGGVHVGAGSDWTTPTGNGSTDSFSVNTWAVNDYFQFSVNTTGFTQIYVGFSAISSGTGPRDFRLDYSSTGGGAGSFTSAGTYTVLENASPNTWSATVPRSATFYTFDLSAIGAVANNANVVFRLVDTSTTNTQGGTVAAAGTSRVDDFTVADVAVTQVPEPATPLVLMGGLGLLIGVRRLRGAFRRA